MSPWDVHIYTDTDTDTNKQNIVSFCIEGFWVPSENVSLRPHLKDHSQMTSHKFGIFGPPLTSSFANIYIEGSRPVFVLI